MNTDALRNPATPESSNWLRAAPAHREPDEGESRVHDEVGQRHQVLRLLREARRTLRALPTPLDQMRVLEVGCGAAGGSRLLVELGVQPHYVVAAGCGSPGQHACGAAAGDECSCVEVTERPTERFELAVQCSVFSRIRGRQARLALARLMSAAVGDEGYILWWDRRVGAGCAGDDALDPVNLFPDRSVVSLRHVSFVPSRTQALRPNANPVPPADGRSHCIALFGPRLRTALSDGPAVSPGNAAGRNHTAREASALARHFTPRPATDAGVVLGAWEPFQHRPLLEVYARHYGHEVVDVDGVLVTARRIPGVGLASAQVYSPEAAAGAEWPRRLAALEAGELLVMTNTPAPGWRADSDHRLASMVVDLRGGPDALWARFEQRGRNAVRRSEKAGVEVVASDRPGDLETFHRIVSALSDGGRRFPVAPVELLRGLLDTGEATLYVAQQDGRPLGGIITLRHRYAHALLSCFDAKACGQLPSAIVYARAMFEEQARGCEFLDLGPHVIEEDVGLVQAKRAYRPLLVPAFRYVRHGRGWRARAISLSRRLFAATAPGR